MDKELPSERTRHRILVIDDDPGLVILVSEVLTTGGWDVVTASSGKEALQWLRKNKADLLLLDLKLHDIDGSGFIGSLERSGRRVPFIIITGQGDERVAVEMMRRGALDYLVKDTHFIEFLPTVVQRGLQQVARESRLVEAEKKVRESAERYRLLVEMAGTVVLLLDEDGTILEWSGVAERVYGHSAAEAIGKNYLDLFLTDSDRTGVAEELRKIFNGTPTVGYENQIVSRVGSRPTFLWNATLLKDDNGRSIGALSIGHDISDRKRLEQELLEIADREQRKFGHDLHDSLGQSLTGLEMLSHALAEDLESVSPDLATQARRLNRGLRETVTQARLISHSLAPVRLEGEGLMRGLTELAESTNRLRGVECRFTCSPQVVVADLKVATHLYRIAQEAVNNALKHGKARSIKINLSQNPATLELSVRNDGKPISAESRESGTGMGLNVMRYRAESIGATLSIESGTTAGVQVTCKLPRTP